MAGLPCKVRTNVELRFLLFEVGRYGIVFLLHLSVLCVCLMPLLKWVSPYNERDVSLPHSTGLSITGDDRKRLEGKEEDCRSKGV